MYDSFFITFILIQTNFNSFHAGSGCKDTSTYVKALKDSKFLFEYAKQIGFDFKFLDIGGGFPGCDNALVSFEEV